MKLVLVITAISFFVACNVKPHEETKDESYSYHFVDNQCDTGEKKFNSQNDMCKGLLDDKSNNYCASNMRDEYYKKKCKTTQAFCDLDEE